MKSKFKNENCKYWGIKRKLFAIGIAQILIVLVGEFLAFATDLDVLDIFCVGGLFLFALFFAEQYYDAEIKRGNKLVFKGGLIMTDDKADLNYLNYQVKHGVPLEKALRNLGYARVETKGSDCDKSKDYTLTVSKPYLVEDLLSHAPPKENILDKPECPCEEGIDSKACVSCEHSEDGKPHPFENYHCYGCDKPSKKTYRPFKDCDELVEFWSKHYQTGFRPANTKPLIWVRLKCDGRERLIVAFGKGFGSDFVEIGNKAKAVTLQKLFDDYEFLDGCVIGVKE